MRFPSLSKLIAQRNTALRSPVAVELRRIRNRCDYLHTLRRRHGKGIAARRVKYIQDSRRLAVTSLLREAIRFFSPTLSVCVLDHEFARGCAHPVASVRPTYVVGSACWEIWAARCGQGQSVEGVYKTRAQVGTTAWSNRLLHSKRCSGFGSRCIRTRYCPCFWQSGGLALGPEPDLSRGELQTEAALRRT